MNAQDDTLTFANETNAETTSGIRTWKLLVVDDDEFVHKVTNMVLADYSFEGRKLSLISAYSAAEAKEVLQKDKDIAVILLDVVMETNQAGLDLANWIRNETNNHMVRIILRTGQPGEAPEQNVIFEYDINDYREKSELTAQKLSTTVTTAIRSYRDLLTIERNRQGLKRIIKASPTIFKTQSLREFASGALTQLSSTLTPDNDSFMIRNASGLAAAKKDEGYEIIAATGIFADAQGRTVDCVNDSTTAECIAKAQRERKSFFANNAFVGYYRTDSGSENIIYLRVAYPIKDNNQELVELFSTNISVAFDNIDLHENDMNTQRDLISTLGEIAETRSSDTTNHVHRVAEYSHILALKSGMSPNEADILKIASPMHDIGKIGIPDSVLLKPGKLTSDEFEIMKRHAVIGYDILKNSDCPIMQTAATLAIQHHERWDGTGYPHGLKGEEIDIVGRITMLADVFDALGCKRVYEEAWLVSDILNFLEEQRGKMFDPTLLDLFMENLDEILEAKDRFPTSE